MALTTEQKSAVEKYFKHYFSSKKPTGGLVVQNINDAFVDIFEKTEAEKKALMIDYIDNTRKTKLADVKTAVQAKLATVTDPDEAQTYIDQIGRLDAEVVNLDKARSVWDR